MPKDREVSTEKSSEGRVASLVTPIEKAVQADVAENRPARKHSRGEIQSSDTTPTPSVSGSALSVRQSSKPGLMGPPCTPTRTLPKTRSSEASSSRDSTPKLSGKPQQDQTTDQSTPLPVDRQTSNTAASSEVHEESDTSEVVDDPETPLDDFDWQKLEQRHFEKLQEFDVKEQEIYENLQRLNMMFHAWASTGHAKESERASKRLKTRISFVQHEESRLEESRQRYVHVVSAFQSALNLLGRS